MSSLWMVHWFLTIMVFSLIFAAIPIVAIWRILKRMGFEPALSLLYIVPFGSLIGLYVIAFSRWPGAAGSNSENP
jgi:hypothetical protein